MLGGSPILALTPREAPPMALSMAEPSEAQGADNHYAQHLAAVNERHNVRASADVYSVHGVLVARRGAAIDYETARKVVRHKLLMPLDRSVELEGAISASGLLRRFGEVLDKYSDLRAAHRQLGFAARFDNLSTRLPLPPLVAQKLTVMALRQPTLFDQAVLGSWFSCLLGKQLGLEDKELALLHIAAVSRDLGMLHVDPGLLERPPDHLYEADDWKALQSHVVASHMILKECEVLPERLLDAVMHHHENIDGTGYPANLAGSEVGLLGQVISLADTVIALRVRRFAGSGRNLRDTLAVLHIDAGSYRADVLSAAVKIIRASGVERTGFHRYLDRQDLQDHLRRRARTMMGLAGLLSDMPNLVPIENRKLAPVVLTVMVERLTRTLARSGLADGEVVKWLGLVAEDKETAQIPDLTEIDLQQEELMWQLRRLRNQLEVFADREKMRARSPVRVVLDRIRSLVDQMEMAAPPLAETGSEEPEQVSHGGAFLDEDVA